MLRSLTDTTVRMHLWRGCVLALALTFTACAPNTTNNGDGNGDGGNGGDGGGTTVVDDALSFEGEVSGKLVDTQSTRSGSSNASAQELPPRFDTANTCVRFNDLQGNPLATPDGTPIGEIPINADGTFDADNLPVGTDFTICGDIGKDGSCEVESCVNIPADEDGMNGRLEDVQVDPLTTTVLARLRKLVNESGINPDDLPVSPAAIVARVVDAYVNLFEDAGIDDQITLEDLEAAADQLGELFEDLVPAGARTGLDIVEGNLAAAQADDADALALAVARVFLRAGFPVVDFEGGPDLSPLGALPNVSTSTRDAIFSDFDFEEFESDPLLDALPEDLADDYADFFPDGLPEDFLVDGTLPEDLPSDLPPELLAELEDLALDGLVIEPAGTEVFYISDFVEPDRNFVEDNFSDGGVPPLPVISDNLLAHMAELHLEGRTITLANLFNLLTDLNEGLGLRLTYFVEDPHFAGPPLTVFPTADGQGLAIDEGLLFERIFALEADAGFDADDDSFVSGVRDVLAELLAPTVAPDFNRLFDGIAVGRVAGIQAVTRHIREARAHVPFSRTGPSTIFVVADGDAFFRDGTGSSAVTVDAVIDREGRVTSVAYNPDGNGRFWLGFTFGTEAGGLVELIVRETGRPLHGQRGPVHASLFDESVFQPVGGRPFADLVTDAGSFYPAVHLPVITDAAESDDGLRHEQMWVLATHAGEDAVPVRVDYDRAAGIATYNPFGRFVLLFEPDSNDTGLFVLFNDETGRVATTSDPDDFFADRPAPDDGYIDLFNNANEDDLFDDFDLIDEFIGETPDGTLPPCDPEIDPLCDPDAAPLDPPVDEGADGTTDPVAPREILGDLGQYKVDVNEIAGLLIRVDDFNHVFGTEVPNPRYDVDGNPYYDDVNNNDMQDPGELTAPFRPTLFDPRDWRSTDIRLYYRRVDGGRISFEQIDFASETPQTIDGVALVPRIYKPRLNAFRFGRPNTAVNMLTAFLPPDFFDGTNELNDQTSVDIFSAMAIINMVMDQVFNIEGNVDVDGFGPLPRRRMLIDAYPFVVPVDDPFVLILDGFERLSTVPGT